MNPIIKLTKQGHYIGLNINLINNEKPKEILILVIDNKSLRNELNYINQNLPRLIKRNSLFIDFTEIILIYSLPSITHKIINIDNIYTSMSKIIRTSVNYNGNDYLQDLYTYLFDIINDKKSSKINCLYISSANMFNVNGNILEMMNNCMSNSNFIYYDFNIYNYLEDLNYYNINEKNDYSLFNDFIKTFYFGKVNLDSINLELINAKFIVNNNNRLDMLSKYCYCLIEKTDNNNCTIKMQIKNDNLVMEKDIIINEDLDDSIDLEYLEYTIENLSNNMNKNEIIPHIENMKNMISDITNTAQTEGRTEILRNLVWINRYLKNISQIDLNEILEENKVNNNIIKFALKSENTIKFPRLKDKFKQRIINNKDLIDKVDQVFNLNNDVNTFLENHLYCQDQNFIKSCETFYSVITVTNWFEELQNGSSMGIMIKIKTEDMAKLGIIGSKVEVQEITLSCIPIKDYIESIIIHFDKNNNDYGNLNNKEIFKGNGIGSSNAVVPLYINKHHWEQAKKHIPYVLGIILAHNPLGYTNNHINFMFYLLSNMTRRSFIENEYMSIMWIKIYMSLLRTCSQIAYEKKYHKGIKSIINNYITNPYKRLLCRLFDNDIIIGQILCTGIKLDEKKLYEFVELMYEDCIRRKVITNYDLNYLKFLQNIIDKDEQIEKEINELIEYIDENTKYVTELLISLIRMYNIIRELTNSVGGFIKLINMMDNNYGVLSEDLCYKIFNKIKKFDHVTYQNLYDEINLKVNAKNRVLLYILRSILNGKDKERKEAIKNNRIININTEDMTSKEVIIKFIENIEF